MKIAGEMRHLIDDPGEAIREGVVLPALQVVVMASWYRTAVCSVEYEVYHSPASTTAVRPLPYSDWFLWRCKQRE